VPGESQSFQYTPFDLPSHIQTGSGAGARNTRFEYSAEGARSRARDDDKTRRIRRRPLPASRLCGRRYARGALSAFLPAVGGSAKIVRANGTDQTLFFHVDNLGTVSTISDSDRAVHHQAFDPFGTPLDVAEPAITREGFTGHEHDQDLGLVDMKGRIYDPLTARFTTADPMMQAPFFSQGSIATGYVLNDPVNQRDPSGYLEKDDGGSLPRSFFGAVAVGTSRT